MYKGKEVLKMSQNMMDNLINKIKEKNSPIVMGIDPRYEMIPEFIKNKYEKNLEGVAEAILEFNKKIIDAVYDIIPAVKPQIAFYEMYGLEGMKVFEKTCKYAKEKDFLSGRKLSVYCCKGTQNSNIRK